MPDQDPGPFGPGGERERSLARAAVAMAATAIDGSGPSEGMRQFVACCAELFPGAEVSVVVSGENPGDPVHIAGASSEEVHALTMASILRADGPIFDVLRGGALVANAGLDATSLVASGPGATGIGDRTVHAVPMAHRHTRVGVLYLVDAHRRTAGEPEISLLAALAELTAISVIAGRARRRFTERAEQLEGALASRIALEQAKGVLSERLHMEVSEVFAVLRAYARNRNEAIDSVARRVVDGELSAEELRAGAAARRVRRRAPTRRTTR